MLERVKYAAALHTGVNGTVSFTGAGTNDMTVSGSSFFATSRNYRVQIDGTETYKWSNDGGSTWEAVLQPIFIGQFIELINAIGEKEGLSIRFGSATGHVVTNRWDWASTGQVVPDTVTSLGGGKCAQGAEYIVLKGEYSKGSETGIQIYFTLPLSIHGTVLYRPSYPASVGSGIVVHSPLTFELQASAAFSYTFETGGNPFYSIYAVKRGGTVSGLFTLFHEVNRAK